MQQSLSLFVVSEKNIYYEVYISNEYKDKYDN